MERRRATHLSRTLSLALRHSPESLGVTLDPNGWALLTDVIAGFARRGEVVRPDEIAEVVRTSDKQRFALSPDGTRIRANQGHSIEVDLALAPREPPETLFHGTVDAFLASILAEGLRRGSRQHVHLSADVRTAEIVAKRRAGEVVILRVHASAMHRDGHVFHLSDNGVWLTEHVPPAYLAR